jgi:uncharacterized RDD family membrane protein YckC
MAEPPYRYKTNLKKRFLASFIDYLLIFSFLILYLKMFGSENEDGALAVQGIMTFPPMIVWFIYFVLIETYYGATLGHKALNLLVLTENRKDIGLKEAFKRHLLGPFDFFMYAIPAIIAIKNTDKKQRLGDLWAKTIVVDMTDPEQFSET